MQPEKIIWRFPEGETIASFDKNKVLLENLADTLASPYPPRE